MTSQQLEARYQQLEARYQQLEERTQQLEGRPQQLEARVETLENEIVELKQILATAIEQKAPWWQTVAGSFRDDPDFDEAVRLGQEWRKTAE